MKYNRTNAPSCRQHFLEVACIFPRHTRAGLWRVVWTMTSTLMIAVMALAVLALSTPQSLRAHVMDTPQSAPSVIQTKQGDVTTPAVTN